MAQMMAIDLVDEMPDTEGVRSRRGHPHSCWVLSYMNLHVWLLRDCRAVLGCWVAALVADRCPFGVLTCTAMPGSIPLFILTRTAAGSAGSRHGRKIRAHCVEGHD